MYSVNSRRNSYQIQENRFGDLKEKGIINGKLICLSTEKIIEKKKFKGKFIDGKVSHSFWRNFFVLRHVNGVVSGKTSAMHNL